MTNKIRFGLRNVKNFGEEIGKAIIAERKANGPFKTIEDFLERVQHKNMNKKSLEALIMCGAMDAFGDRGMLYGNSEELLAFHKGLKIIKGFFPPLKLMGNRSLDFFTGGSKLKLFPCLLLLIKSVIK